MRVLERIQMLLAAFAAAPALTELHAQLPDHLFITSNSLVSVDWRASASHLPQ